MSPATRALLPRLPLAERTFLADALRTETVGGGLLLAAAAVALLWANSPWGESYATLRDFTVGPAALHLDLTLQEWAADGLLAIFFFVAGLELKRELTVGTLREPPAAVVPVAAALAGMVVPVAVFLAVAIGRGGGTQGWAVPMATDIAFALAVLAVIGTYLPDALRAFLLTLAVVDDLGAILVIAVLFTADLHLGALAGATALLGAYALLQRRRVRAWWVYVPLALLVWGLVHESGLHATLAGVALGLLTRVRADPQESHSPAERLEHRVRPLSAGVAVPAFALLSAGVAVSGDALARTVGDPAALAVVAGLVVGKTVGVFTGAYLTSRFTRAELSDDLGWPDVAAVAVLSGIGFTVALLIAELSFDGERLEYVKAAVLLGSLLAAVLAGGLLRARNRHYRAIHEKETRDEDRDGVPDHYQGR